MVTLQSLPTKEVEKIFKGYEEYLALIEKEIKRTNAYKESNPYTDVLIGERNYIIDDCYKKLINELTYRSVKVKPKFTGNIPYDEKKFTEHMEKKAKSKEIEKTEIKTVIIEPTESGEEKKVGVSSKE